ncbi:hypothetical protein QFZ79_001344 [Arthrobacter sp. V4I6]|uniref:hypothetical protein n=1 Tax=unclassified Arthrobacter TaxID=235627 RepID=UPI00278303F1|nr:MULTISPECIES: hypothetical protein [unclassified Arthrobacter]MDQ0823598.1 hypothetical protein [Arthrobacter sp. V1I7]MDQ0853233.1 hypothetical protein [Arthrobacter sp. V4I6]
MQFDLSAVEAATLVFIGTLVFALVLTLFVMTAALAALVLTGVGRLVWLISAILLLGLVRGLNYTWDRLVHHASAVELPAELPGDFAADFVGQSAPSTGTYPRVVLRDS